MINGWGLWAKTGWRGILKDKLLHSLSDSVKTEFSLFYFVSWGIEDNSTIRLNVMLVSEVFSDSINSFLEIICEVLSVDIK